MRNRTDRSRSHLASTIVVILAYASVFAAAIFMIAVRSSHGAQRVILVDPHTGAQHDCGSARTNKRGDLVYRVQIPCGPLATPAPTASPPVTPRPTPSPRVTPRPTASPVDLCPGGCMVWNPVTDTTKCVRPCP